MPTITVNEEARSFPDPLTVADLLRHLDKDPRKLAVEVNREVVPRAEHPSRPLREGDAVEIATLVGGGSGEPGVLTPGFWETVGLRPPLAKFVMTPF